MVGSFLHVKGRAEVAVVAIGWSIVFFVRDGGSVPLLLSGLSRDQDLRTCCELSRPNPDILREANAGFLPRRASVNGLWFAPVK